MSSIQSEFSPINVDQYKFEARQVVGGNALDKPTFGEKLKGFFAKIGSFVGGIAGFIGKLLPFPGASQIGSALGYGLKSLSDRALANMEIRKQQEAMLDAQAAAISSQQSMGNMNMPGFQSPSTPPSGGSTPNVEWSPYAKMYQKEITQTLVSKGGAAMLATNQLKGIA